jgi:hypothetical protein
MHARAQSQEPELVPKQKKRHDIYDIYVYFFLGAALAEISSTLSPGEVSASSEERERKAGSEQGQRSEDGLGKSSMEHESSRWNTRSMREGYGKGQKDG